MPTPNLAATAFLQSRRSQPAKTLTLPVPSDAEIRVLLSLAARSPDHGKLEPWRFVVLRNAALTRLGSLARERAPKMGVLPEKVAKGVAQFSDADLAVAVVFSPKPSEKVPQIEQLLSAGAVCLALLNAALASGWGANWLTGWATHDREFMDRGLGLAAHEAIAGLIYIGTMSSPAPERPRPDVNALTTWATE